MEIPPEWNEVPDLIMEEGDSLSGNLRPEKRKREEISRGWRKQRNEDDIRAAKQSILLLYLIGQGIHRGSMLKNGMKINKRKMIGKHQTSFRRSHRWCFTTKS